MTWDAQRDWPLLESGLAGRLRRDCMEEWERFIHHPFVRGLADGTLPENAFQNFLIQDYLYLVQYTRACALSVHKSTTVEDMRAAAALVSGILDTELPLHVNYCTGWGIDEDMLRRAPESLELLAYSRFILDRAQTGDLLDLLVTLAPCMIGYGEIGARLHADPATRRDGNPYWSWIALYGGQEFTDLVEGGIHRLNRVGAQYGADARYPMLRAEFNTAVRLEAAFWEAGQGAGA